MPRYDADDYALIDLLFSIYAAYFRFSLRCAAAATPPLRLFACQLYAIADAGASYVAATTPLLRRYAFSPCHAAAVAYAHTCFQPCYAADIDTFCHCRRRHDAMLIIIFVFAAAAAFVTLRRAADAIYAATRAALLMLLRYAAMPRTLPISCYAF